MEAFPYKGNGKLEELLRLPPVLTIMPEIELSRKFRG
jgi:hypothetical protein